MKFKAIIGAGAIAVACLVGSAATQPQQETASVISTPTPVVTPSPTPTPTPVPVVPHYSAICNDGSGSYSTGRGTCSWHGGVAYYTGY